MAPCLLEREPLPSLNDVDFAAEHVTYSGPEPAQPGEDGNGPNDDGGDQGDRLEPEL